MVPPASAEIIEQPTKQKAFQYDGELGGHGSCKSTTGCTAGVGFYNHETRSEDQGLLGRDGVHCSGAKAGQPVTRALN